MLVVMVFQWDGHGAWIDGVMRADDADPDREDDKDDERDPEQQTIQDERHCTPLSGRLFFPFTWLLTMCYLQPIKTASFEL